MATPAEERPNTASSTCLLHGKRDLAITYFTAERGKGETVHLRKHSTHNNLNWLYPAGIPSRAAL